MTPLTN